LIILGFESILPSFLFSDSHYNTDRSVGINVSGDFPSIVLFLAEGKMMEMVYFSSPFFLKNIFNEITEIAQFQQES